MKEIIFQLKVLETVSMPHEERQKLMAALQILIDGAGARMKAA